MKKEKLFYFTDVSMKWLKLKQMYVKYSSYNKYKSIIEIHLNTYFEGYRLSQLNDQVIIDFFKEK